MQEEGLLSRHRQAAAILLLVAMFSRNRIVRLAGPIIGLGVISGALMLHLVSPLGIAVKNTDGTSDGGLLFGLALTVFLSSAALLWMRRGELLSFLPGHAVPST